MATSDTLPLTVDTLPDVVVKKKFSLLSLDWYLFRGVSGNRNLPRHSNGNVLCITMVDPGFSREGHQLPKCDYFANFLLKTA